MSIIETNKLITALATGHPKILQVWETGSCDGDRENPGPMYYHIHFMLKDGGRNEFWGVDPKKVFADAEKWLQELPID